MFQITVISIDLNLKYLYPDRDSTIVGIKCGHGDKRLIARKRKADSINFD